MYSLSFDYPLVCLVMDILGELSLASDHQIFFGMSTHESYMELVFGLLIKVIVNR